MKKNVFTIIILVLAAVITVGSVTFLGPCVHEDGSEAPCTKAGRAILINGCMLAALAVLLLFFRKSAIRSVLFVIALCAAVVGILLPGTLFPVCKMDVMHCRMVMQPAMIALFGVTGLICIAGFVSERTGSRKS